MISVIVPVYNVEVYVDRCVQSLLIQNQEIEIILVEVYMVTIEIYFKQHTKKDGTKFNKEYTCAFGFDCRTSVRGL